jgi:serine/threonine protein kinase
MQYLPGGTLASVVDRIRHLRKQGATDQTRSVELTGQVLLDSVNENLLAAAQQVPEHSAQRDWLATAPWPIVVAWIGMQLGRALQAAHEQGVYHRDVKPANVLLSAEGLPRLADFNVSITTNASISLSSNQNAGDQIADDHDEAADTSHGIGGSLAYMAPEHLAALADAMFPSPSTQNERSRQDPSFAVAAPADVYSAGVLLWELWQGQRPFGDEPPPIRDRQWFVKQASHRDRAPVTATRAARLDGSQRVLEQVLRQAIAFDTSERMQSAGELSARLRLALYPAAARLFDPPEHSWASRSARVSPWLIAAAFILLPNIAAGGFNYLYNYVEIIGRHPELKPRFFALANTINSIFFPLGGLLMIWAAHPLAVAIDMARRDAVVDPTAVSLTTGLGRRAAWIGGVLWLAAAIIFSLALVTGSPSLPPIAALHFFGSLLICGGVAAVYPFFGLIVMTTRVYYPCMIRKTMQDDLFDQRHADAKTWCGRFLLAAAGIPLLGLALLLSQETMAKYVVASAVAATAIGLAAAFAASQIVQSNWEAMAEVLSARKQKEF